MTHLDKNLNFDCGVLNGAGTVSSLSSEWTKEISNTPNRPIFLPSNHQQVASKELQKSFQTYSLKITVMSPMFQKLFGTNHRTNMNQQIQDVSISKEKKVPRLFFQLQGNFKALPLFFLDTPWKFHSSPLKVYHRKRKGSSSNDHFSGQNVVGSHPSQWQSPPGWHFIFGQGIPTTKPSFATSYWRPG